MFLLWGGIWLASVKTNSNGEQQNPENQRIVFHPFPIPSMYGRFTYIYHMNVSENRVPPNHPFLIRFSIINHPFLGYPYFWKPPYFTFNNNQL